MSDIILDLRPLAGDERAHRLKQAIDQAGPVDTLNIRVEMVNAHETDELFEVLEENGFDVQPKGGHESTYNITARRIH